MLKDVQEKNNSRRCSTQDGCKDSVVTIDLGDFPSRYRDVCPIGCGSKGLVFSVMDQRSLRRLAVKKLSIKQDEKTKKKLLRQILREIRILHRLEHQNIIKIYHVLVSTDTSLPLNNVPASNDVSNIESIYVGMELLDTDLRNVLSKTKLTPEYIRLFMYQLFRGAKYMHSANVMHRDLNPSNIFINMDTLMLKIGDFGVSRMHDSEYDHTYHLSMPLTTKYYQAPELLLHPHHYTKEVDVWSIGCVFAEMLKGSIAFSGDHAVEQMNLIMQTIPVTKMDWQSVVNAGCDEVNCCAPATAYSDTYNGGCPSYPLDKMIPDAASIALNLLKQLLSFDPTVRIPAEDALNHPYFVSYSNPQDEPCCFRPFRIEDELEEYSVSDLEGMLQNETYSVTSSFSRSTDTTVSQNGTQLLGFDDVNMLRVNSSAGLATNGSYRHLLSLAENNQTDVISESDIRTMACDFDYGVQIHECSFSKDRMSMDFRPISSDAGCFDPYKWDQSSRQTPPKKSAFSGSQLTKNKSHELLHKGVLRSDTGYNSSYCSSINRISTVHSFSHWSLSSPDISSDQEQRMSCNTPDSVSSPPFHTTTDPDSVANSPTLQEEPRSETASAPARRHEDSHQSSSRRHHHHHSHHHHHHSHHHHHHHHHKHRSRQSHTSTTSHHKTVSGDSSNEHVESAQQSDNGMSRQKRSSGKRSKSHREKDTKQDEFVILPKHIIVTNPDNVVTVTQDTKVVADQSTCEEIKEESTSTSQSSESESVPEMPSKNEKTVDKFDKKEAIHEHFESGKRASSAFTKYIPTGEKDTTDIKIAESITPSSGALPQNTAKPGNVVISKPKVTTVQVTNAAATIRNMWKTDLGSGTTVLNNEQLRPRTWSEGCRVRPTSKQSHLARIPFSAKDDKTKPASMLTCSLVQKIRSQFTQLFSDGCCLTTPDLGGALPGKQLDATCFNRMRHFSDDRRFVCLPQGFPTAESAPIISDSTTKNQPPSTCSSVNLYPGPIRVPRTQVECPF